LTHTVHTYGLWTFRALATSDLRTEITYSTTSVPPNNKAEVEKCKIGSIYLTLRSTQESLAKAKVSARQQCVCIVIVIVEF